MCNQNRKRNYFTQLPSPCYCGPAGVNVDTRVKPKWTDGRSLNGEQAGVVTKTVSLLIRVWIISLPPPVILLIHSILSFYKSDYLSVVVALCWPRKNMSYHKFPNDLFTWPSSLNVLFNIYKPWTKQRFILACSPASVQPLQAACANFEPAWWLLPSTVRPIMFRSSTGLQRSTSRGQERGLQVCLPGADGDDCEARLCGAVPSQALQPPWPGELLDWASRCTNTVLVC